jgi:hypothetical protein
MFITSLSGPATADALSDHALSRNKAALDIIRDFADGFCKTVPLSGKSEAVEASGEAKANLSALLKKLADMGFQGAAKYTVEEWQGPLRESLTLMTQDNQKCRIEIWKDLQSKLLTSVDDDKTNIPLEDSEVYGVLRPSNENTPPNGCDRMPNSQNALKILIGDNALTHDGLGSFTALRIDACDAITMTRTGEGVFVNASLFDREGQGVVSIKNNRITALNGDNYVARQSRDGSRFYVKNSHGTELFYIRYLNPTTIQFRGFLGCAEAHVLRVQDEQPIPGMFSNRLCASNNAIGFHVRTHQ